MGKVTKPGRTALMIVGAAVIGYLIGPPIVSAATSVVIKSGNSSAKARVTGSGRLLVTDDGSTDVSGSFVDVSGSMIQVDPVSFADMFAEGTTDEAACDSTAFLTNVTVDGTSGTFTVEVEADNLNEDSDVVMWRGTTSGVQHIEAAFFGGLALFTDVEVTVTGGGSGRWFLYGSCTGVPSYREQRERRAVARKAG